jgi:hypothetical protein
MATASDIQRRERSLLDRPQRLGILPTWWFWNDRENWRHVGWAFGALVVVMSIVLLFVELSPLVAGLIAGSTILLAQGLLEKYVRRQVIARRRLASAEALDELEG